MDAARDAVKQHVSRDGQHDTTIHQSHAPGIQRENISQTQHDQRMMAVDREVHQDHHHTTEQPITHSETLPEQHHHKAIPVEHRNFEHHDQDKLQRSLGAERQQYQHTQTRVEGEKASSEAPVVGGEHVHHHVHETIQPIVNKQTVEPHVVHTTVPIHEVHHNQAQHHAGSALPAMSMDEFKRQGGTLGGREAETSFQHGEPRSLHGRDVRDASGTANGATTNNQNVYASDQRMCREGSSANVLSDRTGGIENRMGNATSERSGMDSRTQPSNVANDRDGYRPSSGQNPAQTAASAASARSSDRTGAGAVGTGAAGAGALGSSGQTSSSGLGSSATSAAKKPSLMDKLNPKKDADGDGKAGFMK